ncbi:DUF2946 family protein [Robbsia sp. Bb-Pol-6]|uniref:DUF2946 family protein n=1 Tax=Robbsia betulipollinis TaxID=2981849 RepID=A0ABT3ZLU9_9BURK|nr:DUF2946 family protein [Robbsia betulipollinis]MCY0387499.1 DUF2946 family protein [Robbsia betulipollinis]
MDQIVRDALAKWPNVPACTGWLLLDRRGQWRMRDDACQAAGGIGDVIRHDALKRFIARNYEADASGRWFFQNGPQRVFVDLAYTPHVVRLHRGGAAHEGDTPRLVDECGNPFAPAAGWFDDQGNVLFSGTGTNGAATPPTIALLHDHDLALFAECLDADLPPDATAHATPDAAVSVSPDGATMPRAVAWGGGRSLPFAPIPAAEIAKRFGFVQRPDL